MKGGDIVITPEEQEKKIQELKNQETPSVKEMMISIYDFVKKEAEENGYSYCKRNDLIRAVFEENGHPLQAYELVKACKQELRDLGYIKTQKVEDQWQTTITKERDF